MQVELTLTRRAPSSTVPSVSATIEDRLTRVEAQLDRIAQLLEQQQAGSAIEEATRRASDALVNIYGDQEVQERVGELVLRLGEPETLEALTRIGVMLPQMEYALQFAAGGPELLEEGLDMVRHKLAEAGADPAEVDVRLRAATDALTVLSTKESLRTLQRVAAAAPGTTPAIEALSAATVQLAEVEGQDALRDRLTETLVLLTQAETLDSLGRVAALVPQIEYAVNALAAGPELLEEGIEQLRHKLAQQGTDQAETSRRIEAGAETLASLSKVETLSALRTLGEAAPALSPFVVAAARAGRMLGEHEGAEALTDRLTETLVRIAEPEALDALTRVAAMTPQLEYAVTALSAGPEMLEEGLALVREWGEKNGHSQHDLNRRLQAVADMMGELSDPKVLEAVTALSKELPALTDTVQQLAASAQRIDLEPLVQVGEVAASPEVSKALVQLMQLTPNLAPALSSLPIQQRTLLVMRTLNEAVENAAKLDRKEGLFGAMRAMSDPSVQRAIGFALNVAARLGEHLDGKKQLPATT